LLSSKGDFGSVMQTIYAGDLAGKKFVISAEIETSLHEGALVALWIRCDGERKTLVC
jgi:hypothetical protein